MEPWIVEVLLPKVLADAFPAGARLVAHEIGTKKGGNAGDGGFASNTFQIKITVATGNRSSSDYIIAKIFPQDPALRALHNTALQIFNEVLWYKEIVPVFCSLGARFGLAVDHLWPKFYASVEGDIAAIVMEDLSKEGFTLALPAASLSWEHARLAMEKIAQMHALGYTLAALNPDAHKKIVDSIKDCRFGPEGEEMQVDFLIATAERGLGPLRSRPECADLVAAVDKAFTDTLAMHRQVLLPYDKSTDVLCHGDFLRNNVLYKHDSDGKAIDARLIDFATLRVASPCSDLALYILISVDPKVLEGDGLIKLLRVYYTALTETLGKMGQVTDPWRGNFASLENEFGRCTILAYSICAFFLPLMMAPSGDFQMEDMMAMSPEEQEKANMNLGGPEATQRLVDMLLDLQKRGYHKFW